MEDLQLTGMQIPLSRFTDESRIVDTDGPFRLLVTGVNTEWVNPNLEVSEKAPGYERSVLVNFRAVEKRKALAVKRVFSRYGTLVDGDGQEVVRGRGRCVFIGCFSGACVRIPIHKNGEVNRYYLLREPKGAREQCRTPECVAALLQEYYSQHDREEVEQAA